jgi:catechol 2,3-dioxygenase-like lactoylglutathione lyase family enzyme
MKLAYVIKYVADMEKAVAYFRDKLGLEVRFQSPGWSEFATGETTLALHAASEAHPAGSSSIGFNADDLDKFYRDAMDAGVEFTSEPVETFGRRISRFRDSEGSECSVSGK